MKAAKIITVIAGIIFSFAALGISLQASQFRLIIENGAGNGNRVFLVPIIEFLFAAGCFSFWLKLNKAQKQGLIIAQARVISIILLVLAFALSYALTVWFILLPIYNL